MEGTFRTSADRSSVTAAVEEWGDMVFRLALCNTGNKADADDVCQKTFIKLFHREDPFESKDHEKAWLLRVAANCCNDLFRRKQAKPAVPLESVDHLGHFEAPDLGYLDVREAVLKLPEKQRLSTYLYYYEDYSTDEIARIMDEKPSTIRSHLHRARAALRITLGD